jgi:(S)-2-hydroxyglutarate dehydrogenase
MSQFSSLTIVGGGIVGLASALVASRSNAAAKIRVIEKDLKVGQQQSSHNSGVLHCGLYYNPDSLKAKLAVQGIREMVAFCVEKGIPHEVCGKIVMAVTGEEVIRLRELEHRGTRNGLQGLKWLGSDQISEYEPHARGKAALYVPEEGIVDYPAVMEAMAAELITSGHEIVQGVTVHSVRSQRGQQILSTSAGELASDYVIACAGLHSDRLAKKSGAALKCQIVPFRGDYWTLSPEGSLLVKNLIYPVPDPTLPFLGVHFTRMIKGGVEAGPNAVLSLKREGYSRTAFSLEDALDTLTYGGLYKFIKRYPGVTWAELRNSFSKTTFLKNLQRLIPEIEERHLVKIGQSGVRAQAIDFDGNLLMDFEVAASAGQLHVVNAPSPGATASIAIGKYLIKQALSSI